MCHNHFEIMQYWASIFTNDKDVQRAGTGTTWHVQCALHYLCDVISIYNVDYCSCDISVSHSSCLSLPLCVRVSPFPSPPHTHMHKHTHTTLSLSAVYDALPIMFIYLVVDSTKCVTLNILRSTGRPGVTVAGNAFACVVVLLPLGWFLGLHMDYGITGLWAAMRYATRPHSILLSTTLSNYKCLLQISSCIPCYRYFVNSICITYSMQFILVKTFFILKLNLYVYLFLSAAWFVATIVYSALVFTTNWADQCIDFSSESTVTTTCTDSTGSLSTGSDIGDSAL